MTRPELHPALDPLAFLVGRWEGVGVGDYPTIEPFHFGHEVEVSHDGRPLLAHRSRSWLLDSDTGERVRPLASESGFWRPGEDGVVELVLAHGAGAVEIWLGAVSGPTLALATDVVARTGTAKEITAGRRHYGLVEDELLFRYDMAAVGQDLQPHLSSRLRRVA